MKKTLLLGIALLVPSYPLQADTQTVAAKILKCSWHAAKIGGGMVSVGTSLLPLYVALIAQSITPFPQPTGDTVADNQAGKTYFANLDAILEKHNMTRVTLQEILVWYTNRSRDDAHQVTNINALTDKEVSTALDGFRSFTRNRGFVLFLGLFVSGSASIASGLHGLYTELIAADDNQATDENDQETAAA